MTCAAIQWLPASAVIGGALAERLGVPGLEIALHRFPDGELRVTVGPARRRGARRLVLTAPYLGYMRQDAAFHAGEAISQRAIGDLFAKTFDRVITVEAHLHRTATLNQVFPGIETDNLSAALCDRIGASG